MFVNKVYCSSLLHNWLLFTCTVGKCLTSPCISSGLKGEEPYLLASSVSSFDRVQLHPACLSPPRPRLQPPLQPLPLTSLRPPHPPRADPSSCLRRAVRSAPWQVEEDRHGPTAQLRATRSASSSWCCWESQRWASLVWCCASLKASSTSTRRAPSEVSGSTRPKFTFIFSHLADALIQSDLQ